MKSILILVKEKTLYIQLGEMLKSGDLTISNDSGNTIHMLKIIESNYEVISLDQPSGKYWLSIHSTNLSARKSFHLV